MHRRELLRRGTSGLAVLAASALAGCPGDGEPETVSETTVESMGIVAANDVTGLEVVGLTSGPEDGQFRVTVTVENVGDRATDALAYRYDLVLYDSDDEDITGPGTNSVADRTELAPGEQRTVDVYADVQGDPSDVARYEISLRCDSRRSGTVYCGQ